MRLLPLRMLLLGGPVALAFFSGGFGDRPRLVALAVSALAVGLLALTEPAPLLPRALGPRLTLGGLAALTAWVALSRTWSPAKDAAGDDLERLLLYVLATWCAVTLLRERASARTVELGVAAGSFLVTAYGLAGRLVPCLVPQTASFSAGGRLEQPLTYWNAEGSLAALGVVLCARIAGDRERAVWQRMAAAAAAAPLTTGVYLTFSRGAAVALIGGLVVLLVLAPTWSQLRGVAVCLEAGVATTLLSAASPAVRTLAGDTSRREVEGALVLLGVLVVMGAAALLARWGASAETAGTTRLGRLPLPAWSGTVAAVIVVALVVVPVVAGGKGSSAETPSFGATSQRFDNASSNRYQYWHVAFDAFAHHPLIGVGSGGFRTEWLRERTISERVRDAHSLEIETFAELGLIGALLLLCAIGGVVLCARIVQRTDPSLAAGPIAAVVVFGIHSAVDWMWEMPAVTLPVLSLVGLLAARAGTAEAAGTTARPPRDAPPEPPAALAPAASDDAPATAARDARFPLFDSLRAIAATCVLLVHTTGLSGFTQKGPLGAFAARLDVGVPIFFVISGFLLYRPFVAARLDGRPPLSTLGYARRRILRIVPAYWVALFMTALFLPHSVVGPLDHEWWAYFGFISNWKSIWIISGIGPAWSLCVEAAFYVALPFVALAASRRLAGRPRAEQVRLELIALGVSAFVALAVRGVVFHYNPHSLFPNSLGGTWTWFVGGMSLAVLSAAHHGRGIAALPSPVRWAAEHPGTCWTAAFALMVLAASPLMAIPRLVRYPDSNLSFEGGHLIYAAVAVLVVVPGVFGGDTIRGWPQRMLARRELALLGMVSYGVFLYHVPFLSYFVQHGLAGHTVGTIQVTVATFAAATAAATASYLLVEKPILRFKGRREDGAKDLHALALRHAGTASEQPAQ